MGRSRVDVIDVERADIDHAAALAGEHAVALSIGLERIDPQAAPFMRAVETVRSFIRWFTPRKESDDRTGKPGDDAENQPRQAPEHQ